MEGTSINPSGCSPFPAAPRQRDVSRQEENFELCKEQGAAAEKCSGEQGAARLHMQRSPLWQLQPAASFSLPAIDAAAQESPG